MNTLAPFGTIRSMGSSTLDWCYLASGRYDIYIHGGQKLWDYAAGALIFEEAGGCLTTLEGDDFWSGEHVFKRSVIAALQPELFKQWVKWIREISEDTVYLQNITIILQFIEIISLLNSI